MPLSAGQIGWRTGIILSAGDSWEVTLFGRGAHGSMPQKSIDPVVMAAAAVMRLQTVVSREVAMTDSAVVTVGTLRAGTSENVIPDRALLRLNVRTFKDQVRARVLAAIKRILEAEATASGAPKPPDLLGAERIPADPQRRGRNAEGGGCVRTPFRHGSACMRSSPPRRARISACLAPPGMCLRRSGWSAVSTRTIYKAAEKAGKLDEASGQPRPGLRAGDPPHAAHWRRGDAHRRGRVADHWGGEALTSMEPAILLV